MWGIMEYCRQRRHQRSPEWRDWNSDGAVDNMGNTGWDIQVGGKKSADFEQTEF